MLTNILILLAILAGGLAAWVGMRPDTFRVERHITIRRPPAEVYPLIASFRQWQRWSPWEDLDPALARSYAGPEQGSGAIYEWEGNGKAGKGRMAITRAEPPTHLTIDLSFLRPFKAENNAAFDLEPTGDGTQVSWAMYGPLPFMSKVMSLFVSMDRLIGRDFERGLEKLKTVAESQPAEPPREPLPSPA